MKIQIEMSVGVFDRLWNKSAATFKRENPRKRWSEREKKEAVRVVVCRLIEKEVEPK